jgi:lipid-A-disaccharide synthase
MVNLVAGRAVAPEIMQSEMTGERLAAEVARLLDDGAAREAMRQALAGTARKLMPESGDAMTKAAALIAELMEGHVAHVS